MNATQLKALHKQSHPESHIFDRSNMVYFGDTMKNFFVETVWLEESPGVEAPFYVLRRNRPVRNGLRGFHVFEEDGNFRPDLQSRV